jgi:hypothetical protein
LLVYKRYVVYMAPVTDSEGNVYVAWGSELAAVSVSGEALWTLTIPQGTYPDGAGVMSQIAVGNDGTLYVTWAEAGDTAATWVVAAY